MSSRILLCSCIVWMSSCVLPCLLLADEPVPAASQPGASTQEIPLVWAVVEESRFDASHMYNSIGPGPAGAMAIHPLESGELGVFLAQSTLQDKKKQRAVFVDDKGVRHVGDCGGWADTGSVCIMFYRTSESCPLKSVRKVLIEQRVPETDPLVQRQKEDQEREARKPEMAKRSPLPALLAGKPYPFVLSDFKGGRIDSKQLLGKVVILDFWVTWCGPCIAEIPRLKGLYERYHEQGLEIVGIDMGEQPQRVASFVQAREIAWLQAVLSESEHEAASAATEISGIPHFLVLDRQGVLRDADARKDLEKTLDSLLGGESEQEK